MSTSHEMAVLGYWSNYQRLQDFLWGKFSGNFDHELLRLVVRVSCMVGREDERDWFKAEVLKGEESFFKAFALIDAIRERERSLNKETISFDEEMQAWIAGVKAQHKKRGLYGLGLLLSEIRACQGEHNFLDRFDFEDQLHLMMPKLVLDQMLWTRIRACGTMTKIVWTHYLKWVKLRKSGGVAEQLRLIG